MSSLGNYQVAWLSNPFLGHILVISLHSLSLSKITKSLGGKTKCCDDINKSKHSFCIAKYFFLKMLSIWNYFQMSCEKPQELTKNQELSILEILLTLAGTKITSCAHNACQRVHTVQQVARKICKIIKSFFKDIFSMIEQLPSL